MIKQTHTWDCAHCSLAMYLDSPPEQIYLDFPEQDGIPVNQVAEYLWSKSHDVDWQESSMPTKRAIVIVESKNYGQRWHAIYFDGKTFFDPSSREVYVEWDDIAMNIVGTLE